MINVLIALILLSVFVQPDWTRAKTVLIFGGMVVAHAVLFANAKGLAYYASAAATDLAIIILTSFFTYTPKLAITIHKICLAFIGVNLVGWGLWFTYLPPLAYDAACILLYMYTLTAFTTGGGGYVRRSDRHNGWYTNLFVDHHTRTNTSHKDSGEI
tara:strand:+ start:2103 stop:2573 length:471 start_codon:yes stop_codon:yes gene_type:complete